MLMELLLFVIAKTDAGLGRTCMGLTPSMVRMLTTEDTDPVGKAPRVC